jgi:hypothetical protein
MAQQRWRAVILTQSNRLEVVEFESTNNNVGDASAQCRSMFAAKEIKSIHPAASGGSSNESSSVFRPQIGGDWTLVLFLLAVIVFIIFWPYFLIGGVIFGIYKLIKRYGAT